MAIDTSPTFVTTTLHYFVPPPDNSKAWQSINADPSSGARPRNFSLEPREVQVENLRGREGSVGLDDAGFLFAKSETACKSFTEENEEGKRELEKVYYPESEELIKKLTGATRVVIFDHTIRRRRPGDVDSSPDKRQPVFQVHVDQTPSSSVARVHRHLPASLVPSLLPPSARFQIINLWRPIDHPALDHPLALCHYSSVDAQKDLIPVTLVYPDREGETYGVQFNPAHKWMYLRGMTPEETVLIKCFDSKNDGSVAMLTPHTAFDDPATPPDAPLRQSIELRALVFYE